jgi:hypothetical protein
VRDHVLTTIVSQARRDAEPRDVTAAPGVGIASTQPRNLAVNSTCARWRARPSDNGGFVLLIDKLASSLLERFLNTLPNKRREKMDDWDQVRYISHLYVVKISANVDLYLTFRIFLFYLFWMFNFGYWGKTDRGSSIMSCWGGQWDARDRSKRRWRKLRNK